VRRPAGDPCAALTGVGAPYLGGPGSTERLAAILAPVERFGLSAREAFHRVAGPFPIAGQASWSNDWHVRRCEPYPHLHEGIDLFTAFGAPVVATAEARVTQKTGHPIAGLSVELTDDSGVQYFYAHLSGFAEGLSLGQPVQTGQVLGYVGTTGNARGASPHLHLEIQPGGVPVPPKPYVDRWLVVAERSARRLVRNVRGSGRVEPSVRQAPASESAAGPAIEAPTRRPAPWSPAGGHELRPTDLELGAAGGSTAASTAAAMGLARLVGRRRRRPPRGGSPDLREAPDLLPNPGDQAAPAGLPEASTRPPKPERETSLLRRRLRRRKAPVAWIPMLLTLTVFSALGGGRRS
jgi:murein DD-endopeptidase MepM/ murein hydrolase activator NlpD